MEVKSDKTSKSLYRKEDLDQLRDHHQWVLDNSGSTDVRLAFVGPILQPSPDSNPDSNLMIVELEQFRLLGQRLRAAVQDTLHQATHATLPEVIYKMRAFPNPHKATFQVYTFVSYPLR